MKLNAATATMLFLTLMVGLRMSDAGSRDKRHLLYSLNGSKLQRELIAFTFHSHLPVPFLLHFVHNHVFTAFESGGWLICSTINTFSPMKSSAFWLMYKLIFGTGLPVHLENMAVTIGWIIKSAYLVPTNSTIYTDPYMILHRKRSIPATVRYDLYRKFEEGLKRHVDSGDSARHCLLRAICEATLRPFKGFGLTGKVLSIIFRPSSTEEIPETEEEMGYHIAEQIGRRSGLSCESHYSSCNFSLIDLVSRIL